LKHIEFIKAVSEYYGEYSSKLVERMTFEYIQDRFKESDLENVFKTIIIKVNPKFKTPPSPADFEEFFPRVNLESEAHKWYDRLNNTGCSLDNIIVSDIQAEKALDAFGGWIGFCSRKPDNEVWDRKNFVTAYINAIPGNDQPSIIYGDSSRKYEKTPLIFGDKEICKSIIDNREKPLELIDNMVSGFKI
jgi:hypothetical protein